jgi:kynurenine formamidase
MKRPVRIHRRLPIVVELSQSEHISPDTMEVRPETMEGGTMSRERLADGTMEKLFESLKNWGKWGDEDESGALNYITDEVVRYAASRVISGRVVSCSLPLPTVASAEESSPAQHLMMASGDALDATGIPGFQQTVDFLGIACHGMGITHLDALCHMFVNDQMYNGAPPTMVKSTGAFCNSLAAPARGIVTRGVLLDIPRSRGIPWLRISDAILPSDLDAAAVSEGVQVRSGDAVLVSTGRDARRRDQGPSSPFDGMPGLHPMCLPWLHDHEIAVLGGDGISDILPNNATSDWAFPIHQCGIAGIGLHLIDNLRLDSLSAACDAVNQWDFLLSVAPLRAERATGCAVNPLAVL